MANTFRTNTRFMTFYVQCYILHKPLLKSNKMTYVSREASAKYGHLVISLIMIRFDERSRLVLAMDQMPFRMGNECYNQTGRMHLPGDTLGRFVGFVKRRLIAKHCLIILDFAIPKLRHGSTLLTA